MTNSSSGGGSETTGADTGFTTNLGIAAPGSPADAMGTTPLPSSGGLGAADPAAEQSLSGDEQGQDRGIVDEGQPPAGGSLMPRLVEDIDPQHSIISGPTNTEEGRGS